MMFRRADVSLPDILRMLEARFSHIYGIEPQLQINENRPRNIKDKTFSLGMSAPVGPGKVLLGYANTRRDGSLVGTELERDTVSLGYDYLLSKRTDIYTVLMSDKITAATRAGSFGIGVRHRF